jgi:hypothetical protein
MIDEQSTNGNFINKLVWIMWSATVLLQMPSKDMNIVLNTFMMLATK